MKELLWFLAVLGCTAAAAMAGPNEGGMLFVHNTGTVYTAEPVFGPDPTACSSGSVNTQMPLWDGVTPAVPVSIYWKVYAAFPLWSSPRLASVAWGTQFPEAATSPTSYVHVTGGSLAPPETGATVFYIGGHGFPTASGGTIGQSFPSGARTTLVTPLFMFWGWGYGHTPDYPTWRLVSKTGDDNFGDDDIPVHTDQIEGYGSLGFGVPGWVPCEASSDIPGACCNLAMGMPDCHISTEAGCRAPFTWLGADVPCNVETCPVPPPPTGACCNLAVGMPDCHISTAVECLAPYTWRGAGVLCDVQICPVPPTGACCNLGVGMPDCHISTAVECLAPYTWLGAGVPCDIQICPVPPPRGACCRQGVEMTACQITTAVGCAALGAPWAYLGDGIPCNNQTCPALPEPIGNCCDRATPECLVTTESWCVDFLDFEWLGTVPCDVQTNCNMPVNPEGACCWVADGRCTITTQAGCVAPGSWLGAFVPCNFSNCPVPMPVQRSSWGQIKNIYR